MNRKILFRGKCSAGWIYGDLIHQNGSSLIKPYLSMALPIQSETAGQYTGLDDKSGNKIFEGDILSAHLDDLFPKNETRLTVVWHETGWYGLNCDNQTFDDFENGFQRFFEVIGNIHDNPELLSKDCEGRK